MKPFAFIFALLIAGSSMAQNLYPIKPVTFVVPFAAGGTTDIAARVIASELDKTWNQRVLVEARPGAAQVVGTDYVVRAAPDGYTLLMGAHAVAVEQVLNKAVTFDIRRDLTPVVIVCGSNEIVASSGSLPVATMLEWIAYVKANPGKLNWASVGAPEPEFLQMLDRLQLKVAHIPYKGGLLAMQAVAAGEAQIFGGSPSDAFELSKAGRVRPLMYTGMKRHRLFPDVPTAGEVLGFDVPAGFWFGLFGPARLPQTIADKVRRDVQDALKRPDVAKKYEALGLDIYDDTPDQMRVRIEEKVKSTESLLAKGLLTPR